MLENLPSERRSEFERDFVAFHEKFRTDSGIAMPRDYLVTIGVRKWAIFRKPIFELPSYLMMSAFG